jgi:UDP:flavonoid glycosyltransferase YjiC (YdhE family)
MTMANILFVTWDGGGNVPPAIGIAAELQRRGDNVRVLGHQQQRNAVEGAGLRFESYSRPRAYASATPKSTLRMFTSLNAMVKDRSLGIDVLDAAQREPSDLVVIDCVLQTVLEAAEQANLRRAVLVHSFYSMGAWSMGSDSFADRLRRRSPSRPWGGADLGLIATLRSLDPDGSRAVPASIHFTGPVWQGTPGPASPPDGEPNVLVSLSTCSFPGQEQVLQNVLDSLVGLPVRAIVTTGPAVSPGDLRPPVNAELYEYLPHAEVLPNVSLVIGHGGHATTMAALAHDLPVIVLPMFKFMDQQKIGQAVQDAGAGRLLPKRSSPTHIRQAIQQLLSDKTFRLNAARLGIEIRQQDGATIAADAIAQILAKQPSK